MNYKGMNKAIEEASTGALAEFHTIVSCNVDFKSRNCTVTIQGYVSEEKKDQGRQLLTQHSINVPAIPQGVDPESWLYETISAPVPAIEGIMNQNIFAGATLIPA